MLYHQKQGLWSTNYQLDLHVHPKAGNFQSVTYSCTTNPLIFDNENPPCLEPIKQGGGSIRMTMKPQPWA